MNNEELKSRVHTLVPESIISENKQFLTVSVPAGKLHQLAKELRYSDDTAFDYLFCLSGADMKETLMVVYHLTSTIHHHDIVLKVNTPDRDNPTFDTVSDIWRTADFHEREVYDFFGIKFNNHPDMRRIFLDETTIKGFPFRKDYVDKNIIER